MAHQPAFYPASGAYRLRRAFRRTGAALRVLHALSMHCVEWGRRRNHSRVSSRPRGERHRKTLRCGHEAASDDAHSYLEHVRKVVPWLAALTALVALWPTVCMSDEGGPTTCQSAVFLPLPWGDTADTWGFLVAIGAALLTFIVLRRLLRRRTIDAG